MMEFSRGCFSAAIYYAAVVFDETALVPVGTILVIGGGIWWLGRKLQHVEDKIKEVERRIDRLPCNGCDRK